MAVEIKTAGVKPVRTAFEHLIARFGDKPATRYQEFAFDTQPKTNFHYRPLWDPDHEIYDKSKTAIVMADWYALKDPRQFYYGSYTIARAKQQDAIDQQMAFLDERGALSELPDQAKRLITFSLVALRHYEWGSNTNNNFIAAYGYGTTITQAATMAMCDRLAMAQHLSRIGLFLDDKTGVSLDEAKEFWMSHSAWQGLRRQVENMFVVSDWFELMVAQNLVADGIVCPLIFQEFDRHFRSKHGNDLSSLTNYSVRWQKDFTRWVDAVIKTAAAESAENRELIDTWVKNWHLHINSAIDGLASELLGDEATASLTTINNEFNVRLSKLGLSAI
ncbi:aromatic/alkene monooxygenase hydroxylase subunit beta [Zhongshania sp. BJYM1]|uniref:aromatic/alkene monooxygenase hydroxylase subunit beta n=1 Tax=Zhongshania aquatica TaxID=2965069 RepID=UPI0022B38A29|nr:aromatic/alkene monooxygenase hydroxylase subunit beta [Marortus sp. BJYM1]